MSTDRRATRTADADLRVGPSSTSALRLLSALAHPALRRVAGDYGLEPRVGAEPVDVVSALAALAHFDPVEVVRHELRHEELVAVAERLGFSSSGTRGQVTSRLVRGLRYRLFAEAREYARGLELRNHLEWRARFDEGDVPADLPRSPDLTYRGLGWTTWGDFLGTGNKGRNDHEYRPFEEARALVRSLGFKSGSEWLAWCQGQRPELPPRTDDVPTNPQRTYRGEWQGVGDWLGTGAVQTQRRVYRPFVDARMFARSLRLKSQDEYFAWWRRAGREALDVPGHPQRTYEDDWEGWGDFLGSGNVAPSEREFLPFREARAYVHALGLGGRREWLLWLKGELEGKPARPNAIPTNPHVRYKREGWTTLGDWLGTGVVSNADLEFWPFERARAFVRALGLRNQEEFVAWRAGRLPGKPPRPPGVPTNPNRTYADRWIDMSDWLGKPAGRKHRWRPFEEARAFARSLGLCSANEWTDYAAGRRPDLPPKPSDVPASPEAAYKGVGWIGTIDWLRGPADSHGRGGE